MATMEAVMPVSNQPNHRDVGESLMTLSEAAARLDVSYDTMKRWVDKGVFKRVVRVGPHRWIRLYRADVEAQLHETGH